MCHKGCHKTWNKCKFWLRCHSLICRLAFALSEVIMDNNRLSGSLPSELGILRSLKLLDVRNNSAVSCIGNSSTAADQTCSAQQLLPCFMTLGEIRVPRTDGSNLACPLLLRRPLKQAIEACSGDGPRLLVRFEACMLQHVQDAAFPVRPAVSHLLLMSLQPALVLLLGISK